MISSVWTMFLYSVLVLAFLWFQNHFPQQVSLRYYSTFKMRKIKSFFYKINTCLQKAAISTVLQVEQIFSVNIWYIYIYFSILSVVFAVPFLSYFQKLQLLVVKKFWNSFCCIVLLFVWAQKVCLRFLKSYFKLEILIFSSFLVPFFSRYVQLKSSFSDEKSIIIEICDSFWGISCQSLTWQSIKEKFHHWQKLELCKVVHNAKLH